MTQTEEETVTLKPKTEEPKKETVKPKEVVKPKEPVKKPEKRKPKKLRKRNGWQKKKRNVNVRLPKKLPERGCPVRLERERK